MVKRKHLKQDEITSQIKEILDNDHMNHWRHLRGCWTSQFEALTGEKNFNSEHINYAIELLHERGNFEEMPNLLATLEYSKYLDLHHIVKMAQSSDRFDSEDPRIRKEQAFPLADDVIVEMAAYIPYGNMLKKSHRKINFIQALNDMMINCSDEGAAAFAKTANSRMKECVEQKTISQKDKNEISELLGKYEEVKSLAAKEQEELQRQMQTSIYSGFHSEDMCI